MTRKNMMEHFIHFLESSTFHGLSSIATGRKYVRLFWILVVIAGFTGAGLLIHESFQSWEESPVKTTVETRPITEITFPKVTVCPPKNTYTDLNHDLMITENITLDNDTRNELTHFAMEHLFNHLHLTILTNLSMLEEKNRYYNWYHGYTKITLPYYGRSSRTRNTFIYNIRTGVTSGTIFTKNFGEKFDADNVDTFFKYMVFVNPPNGVSDNVKFDPNVTLHFELEKIQMKDLSTGKDKLEMSAVSSRLINDLSISHFSRNFTPPGHSYNDRKISLQRSAILSDIRKQKLEEMPGFKFAWFYSGKHVDPISEYFNEALVRLVNTFLSNVNDSTINLL